MGRQRDVRLVVAVQDAANLIQNGFQLDQIIKHTRNAGFNQSLKTRRVLHVQSSLRYRKAAPAPQAIPNALPTLSVEAHALTNLLICNISLLLLYKCGPPLISNSKEPTRTQAHFYSCKLSDAVTWRQAHFSETPRKPWTAVR